MWCRSILRAVSEANLVAVGAAPSHKDILDAIHAGADDYLDASAAFDAELEALLQRAKSTRSSPSKLGRTISIASAIGGSGVSTLTANLAAALAQREGRCGLIDLHWTGGDLAMHFNLKPRHSLGDLCRNATGIDQATFAQALFEHGSGVNLLASVEALGGAQPVLPEALAKVLQLARVAFPYVVVDLDDICDDKQLWIAQASDLILLVVHLDVITLLRTRRCTEFLTKSGIDDKRVLCVANRCGQPGELSLKIAEDALGRQIAALVPEDTKTVNTSINVGNPAMLEAPAAKVSKSIQQLHESIASRLVAEAPTVDPDQPVKARTLSESLVRVVAMATTRKGHAEQNELTNA